MIQSVKKVLRASAGTGKTYRLSLEYIALLLHYHRLGLHFSEILVITFTKKATAEIRERIFEQIRDILAGESTGQQLRDNLHSFFNIKIDNDALAALNDIYLDMLTNKHLVQISTIDSFTNTIFKTIISPYLGITEYVVQPNIDENVKDELYRTILQDQEKLAVFRSFFERSELKTINDYERFIESVIRQRWIYHLIKTSGVNRPFENLGEQTGTLLSSFHQAFQEFATAFQQYVNIEHPTKSAADVLNNEFYSMVADITPDLTLGEIAAAFQKIIQDAELLEKHAAALLDDQKNIWNGSKLLRKKTDATQKEKLLELLTQARLCLADYIFANSLLKEEKDLFKIIEHVVARYDELKFRDKVFTHDDISYYTFQYLYDPELSLIDGDSVTNSFYEYLSTYTRFVLIDEFQDTSIIQYKILLPIIREVISGAGVKEYGGAIVVGDEKQSIYGWRGGERDLLLNMPRVLHGAEASALDTSYRSDENIMDFVNTVFAHPSLHETLQEQEIDWPYAAIQAHKKNGAGYVELYVRNITRGSESNKQISSPEGAIREFLQHTLDSPTYKQKLLSGKTAILARRNKDLDSFAAALDELDLPYTLESSNSVLEHRAIKPIVYFFYFLLYHDFYDLLRFLRSDIVLLDADSLKELLLAYRNHDGEKRDVVAILQACSHIPAVSRVLQFWQTLSNAQDLFGLAQKLIEVYNITGHFPLESDAKNIDHFLKLVTEFQNTNREYSKSLAGLLDYFADKRDSEAFKQVGLEDTNAITLMTIHKSKGLEFDNVFLYWNLSSGQGRSFRELLPFLEYDADYSTVSNYLLTFNFDKIVAQSSMQHLSQAVERREAIEELNNFYVALTRAKSNLFLCFVFQKKGGFDKLIQDTRVQKGIPHLLVEHIRSVFERQYEYIRYDENRERGSMGEILGTAKEPEITTGKDQSYLSEYLDSDRSHIAIIDEEQKIREAHVNFKTVFLEQNAVEIGNLVHYYLSFIKTATAAEKESARKKTLAFYGTLISPVEIEAIIDKVDQFIQKNAEIFSTTWTHVYTEFTLFDQTGREQRIDRLMVNEGDKIVEIIDYKTGHVFEQEQIETYIDLVSSLPLVHQQGYEVKGRFLEIDVR